MTTISNGSKPVTEAINVGDIFYSSWGYEQTNIDFYEVVGKTPASLKLRKIEDDRTPRMFDGKVDHTSGGMAMPVKGKFKGEVFTKRYKAKAGCIKICSYACAWLWDGKPKSYTNYA